MAATSVNASVALPARQLSLGVEHEALVRAEDVVDVRLSGWQESRVVRACLAS
ncbi:hypothetical protein PC116_g8437 [Phytophthora cactorum]|nr:hypothetical protein Pcac1_g23191 [Phytophthora cactorum]KAG4243744.1 hypothetical protein PC116_g8437 [Phytophthora cactorum]